MHTSLLFLFSLSACPSDAATAQINKYVLLFQIIYRHIYSSSICLVRLKLAGSARMRWRFKAKGHLVACEFPNLLDSLIAKLKDILDSSRETLFMLGIVVLQTNLQFNKHMLILLIILIRKDKMRYLFKQRFCKAKFDVALSCSLPFNSLT